MKLIIKYILVLIFVFQTKLLLCDDLALTVSFMEGVKSKDSHTTTENFSISGFDITYSVKYTGMRPKNKINSEKTCVFTEQNIKNIRETILAKGLNVTDSLIYEGKTDDDWERYSKISASITMDGVEYNLKFKGQITKLNDSDLYNNMVSLVTMLRKMVMDC